jgi:hypothetical protein
VDLRCNHKKFAEILEEEGVLEIKCSSSFCGAGPGTVVLHRFDLQSGKMVETRKYAEPRKGGV